jgi:hypothetical protein
LSTAVAGNGEGRLITALLRSQEGIDVIAVLNALRASSTPSVLTDYDT